MSRIRCLLLIMLVFSGFAAEGQRFEWNVDFGTVFDNREGDKGMAPNKTFFQTQLSPEVGVSMFDGQHRLMGGVVWTQPIGYDWYGKHLAPTLYYRYTGRSGLSMSLGMFPRTQMLHHLPNYIWNDSVNYAQRNIRGFLVSYQGHDGYVEALVDWKAMQSKRQREAFSIIAHGEWRRPSSPFLAGGVAMMNHLALSKNPTPDQRVVDNFVVNPYVGVDLSRHTPLDSLAVRAGALASLTRSRFHGKAWKTPVGAWLAVDLRWWRLGLHNTLYCEGRLFPFYNVFGSQLDLGEPYYQSTFYDRATVYGTLLVNKFVNLRASLDFNFARHHFTFYQRLILRVYIDCNFKKLPKNYKLPQAYEP